MSAACTVTTHSSGDEPELLCHTQAPVLDVGDPSSRVGLEAQSEYPIYPEPKTTVFQRFSSLVTLMAFEC